MLVPFFLIACAATTVHAFYLPGVAPREFQQGETVPLKVNKLTSTKTQLVCARDLGALFCVLCVCVCVCVLFFVLVTG